MLRVQPPRAAAERAFLDRREERWTDAVIDRGPRERSEDPKGQLLAIFDVMDDWFQRRSDYEACSFVKILLEMGTEGRIREACLAHLDKIRTILRARAEQASFRDAKELAWELNILIKEASFVPPTVIPILRGGQSQSPRGSSTSIVSCRWISISRRNGRAYRLEDCT